MVTNTPPNGKPAIWYEWLFGQPAYIVILVSLLAAIAYGTWYGLPAALNQIQAGYEKIDARHASERKEMREDAKSDRAEFREAIENNTEAIERLTEGLMGR